MVVCMQSTSRASRGITATGDVATVDGWRWLPVLLESTKLSTWALPIHSILFDWSREPISQQLLLAWLRLALRLVLLVALARCGALCAGPDRRASAVSIAVLWHLLA
jgi:hypothetical protein